MKLGGITCYKMRSAESKKATRKQGTEWRWRCPTPTLAILRTMRLAREPTTMPLPLILTPILVVVNPVYGEIQVEDRNINVIRINYWFSSSKKEKCFPDEFHRFFAVFRF